MEWYPYGNKRRDGEEEEKEEVEDEALVEVNNEDNYDADKIISKYPFPLRYYNITNILSLY
jgi:hypothetical protein